MKKYYTKEDLIDGLWVDGIQIIPPFTETLLRNLRSQRRIGYQKLGRSCTYTLEQLEAYIDSTKVEIKKRA